MGSHSIPPKTLSDESINRGLVCTHMHFIARTQKILTFMCPRRINAGNKNTPSMHHPRRRNVATLMVGLKNSHICKNLTQKWWTPEIQLGNAEEEEEDRTCWRQFAAQWGDCKNSRIAPLDVIILLIITVKYLVSAHPPLSTNFLEK